MNQISQYSKLLLWVACFPFFAFGTDWIVPARHFDSHVHLSLDASLETKNLESSFKEIFGIVENFSLPVYPASEPDPRPRRRALEERELSIFGRAGLLGAFIITPTYQSFNGLTSPREGVTREQKRRLNQAYSDMAERFPNRAWIWCGADIHDDSAFEVAPDCLEMRKVIGIKVRNLGIDPEHYGGNRARTERFSRILQLANRHRKSVLAHFSGIDPLRGIPRETEMLIAMLRDNPNAKLVIAHSGVASFIGLDGLRRIGNYFRSNPFRVRNIYLETSSLGMAGLDNASCSQLRPVAEAWRAFGLDYVMFGSDYPYRDERFIFEDCNFFTPAEKAKIYRQNAQRFLGLRN